MRKRKPQFSSLDVRRYNVLSGEISDFLSNVSDIPISKSYPSSKDYEKGYFFRYFFKRVNEDGYQEISKETYDSISSRDKKYDHNLCEVGKIQWVLRGNVYKENALAIERVERQFRNISYLFPILNEFQLPDIQNQENLYTQGGELYKADGTEYVGKYHIHVEKGPMEGAFHIEAEHPKLYYLNQLPTPRDMSYEDFLKEYPPPNVPVEVPEATPNRDEGIQPRTESYNCVVQWSTPPSGYTGYINTSGQAPTSTNCIDPGDGTGTFKYSDYAGEVLSACESMCDGSMDAFGIGCLLEFDPNFCAECQIPDLTMCTGTYTHNIESFNPDQEQGWYTCFCGNYDGLPYYSQICC